MTMLVKPMRELPISARIIRLVVVMGIVRAYEFGRNRQFFSPFNANRNSVLGLG